MQCQRGHAQIDGPQYYFCDGERLVNLRAIRAPIPNGIRHPLKPFPQSHQACRDPFNTMIVWTPHRHLGRKRIALRLMLGQLKARRLCGESLHHTGNRLECLLVVKEPPLIPVKDDVFMVPVIVCHKLVPRSASWSFGLVAEALPDQFFDSCVAFDQSNKGVIGKLKVTAETSEGAPLKASWNSRKLIRISKH
ncbi:hypothetical protein [Piscinibacter sp. HJYY11]|uniref:hypothetical protein n=1 Tax=Piscinibacter sp. HJYY11 TaxID=2801333 RepID=UPI00191D2509|nr:hypothetical protein [Piscinibacter sp. HJYY11]MBL0726587.1 hypothetical protein [Piscinibacter sp. HJYY11]